ncbi:hypothetical protein PBI_BIGNUZ_50 [Mycobacterium phage BigNuz]|uniref:Uncharacterized protein n=1 Tax=Mycobacterium phage BigNuz TaxID=1074309 RepID=G1JX65_9CAUD|nr:hypothetical protein PBI_BIGNUZ_50 [Mycobacterium phage BigNuz]AEL98213.1 hypothetical protein PBI_BIGNUZ_50 [Mycobacterium phage BigNuz]
MTRPPTYHYQRADELVAELEQADPRVGMALPRVQLKFRLAELHAQLAQSPWHPGIEAASTADEAVLLLDCRECGYPFNKCAQLWTGQRKCCPDCDHRPPAETHTAKGDYL